MHRPLPPQIFTDCFAAITGDLSRAVPKCGHPRPMKQSRPMSPSAILWSFRRCPYAMRARGAILAADIKVELREIVLRNKPEAFLQTSPSATVPALRLPDRVLDESLDIMIWALQQNDPDRLLDMPADAMTLIETNDGPFKAALDHTKYASRHPDLDPEAERQTASGYLMALETRLAEHDWLCGDRSTLADHAIWPFVRQFANTDRAWFDAQPWPHLIAWLARFTDAPRFTEIMPKFTPWAEGDEPVWFGRT